jgi:hypothetical protein
LDEQQRRCDQRQSHQQHRGYCPIVWLSVYAARASQLPMVVARRQQYHVLDSQRPGANGTEMLGVQLAGTHSMVVTASLAVHMYMRWDEQAAAATLAADRASSGRVRNLGQAPSAAECRYVSRHLRIGPRVADETVRGREFAGEMPVFTDGRVSS